MYLGTPFITSNVLMTHPSYTLQALADIAGCELQGDADYQVASLCSIDAIKPNSLCFIRNKKACRHLSALPQDAAYIVTPDLAGDVCHALIAQNPELAYAVIAELFSYRPKRDARIHKTAVIAKTATIAGNCYIGPHVVIGEHAVIAAGAVIEAGCYIGDYVECGEELRLMPRVTIYHRCVIGARVTIHSGAIIGCDGFGNVMDANHHWQSVPQIGKVVIGNDVNIGANTTIDCGALEDTVVGNGVRLDNQIQIAHNVTIGDHSALAGCVGVAGSTNIGRHCMIGGGCCISGHLDICDGAILTGMSMVTKSITQPGVYSSGTGLQGNRDWHRSVARFRQLDELAKRIARLERQ